MLIKANNTKRRLEKLEKIEIETKNNKKGFIRQKDILWIKKSKKYLNIGDHDNYKDNGIYDVEKVIPSIYLVTELSRNKI